LSEALFGEEAYGRLKRCAKERWLHSDYPGVATCFTTWGDTALDAVEHMVVSSQTTLPPVQAAFKEGGEAVGAAGHAVHATVSSLFGEDPYHSVGGAY